MRQQQRAAPEIGRSLLAELRLLASRRLLPRVVLQCANGRMRNTRAQDLQEAVNICDRWLLSMQPVADGDPLLPLLPRNLLDANDVLEKMRHELVDKLFCSDYDSACCTVRALLMVMEDARARIHAQSNDNTDVTVWYDEDATGTCGQVGVFADDSTPAFVSPSCPRVLFLTRRFGAMATARMLVRYECVGNGSQHWGDAFNVHRWLHQVAGVRTEGFASPLNSKLLGLENAAFCSCFGFDVDAKFGSIGDFFDADFAQRPGGWTVNPPFIESVMDRAADKVVEHLRRLPDTNWFFATFPNWPDNRGWRTLDACEFKRDRIDMQPRSFIMQSCYGAVLTPHNYISIFVLGRSALPDNVVREARQVFVQHDVQKVEQGWVKRMVGSL